MGKGNWLGDLAAAKRLKNYEATVKCTSFEGELIAIKLSDFYEKFFVHSDTKMYIT